MGFFDTAASALRSLARRLDSDRGPAVFVPGVTGEVRPEQRADAATGGKRSDSCCAIEPMSWLGVDEAGSLSDEEIDFYCRSQLMYRIVTLLVFDAMRVAPDLSGPAIGDLGDVWKYMEDRHFTDSEVRSLIYSRQYGGGATVMLVDDGRRMSDPIDLTNVRSVLGYVEVRRRFIVPGPPSRRVDMTWWGVQYQRPAYYVVTPWTGDIEIDDVWRQAAEEEGVEFGRGTFSNVHPSRILAYPYRKELDYLQARRFAWRGWGPGVVEGVLDAFLARTRGILRTADIVNSFGYDFLQMPTLHDMLRSPGGARAVSDLVDSFKQCRDRTGSGVPVVVTGPEVGAITPMNRSVTGLPDLIEAQRTFLLDTVEYPRIKLFGSSGGGLSGKDEGEHRTYRDLIDSYLQNVRWPGIRQAAMVAMAAKDGPTGGAIDSGIVCAWQTEEAAAEDDRAEARKRDTEAREKDAIILGLSPADFIRLDPTIERTYPGIQAALENGLLTVGAAKPATTVGPDDGTTATPAEAPDAAPSTPADASVPMASAGLTSIAAPDKGDAPAASATSSSPSPSAPSAGSDILKDLVTEAEARRMLRCGAGTFASWVTSGRITPWYAGGGRRYSLAEVIAAASQPPPKRPAAVVGEDEEAEEPDVRADALRATMDGLRMDPFPNEHAARQRPPGGFSKFRRKNIEEGVTLILGRPKGGGDWQTQSVRFASAEWSPAEARAWLREHDYKGELEPATGGRTDADAAIDGKIMAALTRRPGR